MDYIKTSCTRHFLAGFLDRAWWSWYLGTFDFARQIGKLLSWQKEKQLT